MITKRGSQNREPLSESGYDLVGYLDRETIVLRWKPENDDLEQVEVWGLCDDHAGYTIEVDGKGFEFVRDYKPKLDGQFFTFPKKQDAE
jgi:hypothetical protein